MTKRDFNVTRTIQNQRSTGCCSCVVDDQCNCKYLPARPMTCIGLLGRLESIYALTLPFFGPVSSWIATVTFSTPIESLSDQGASKLPGTPAHDITQGPTEFQISNNTVDAVQCAGSVATLFLEIKGVTSATVISAITVNGQTVCTGDIPIG